MRRLQPEPHPDQRRARTTTTTTSGKRRPRRKGLVRVAADEESADVADEAASVDEALPAAAGAAGHERRLGGTASCVSVVEADDDEDALVERPLHQRVDKLIRAGGAGSTSNGCSSVPHVGGELD
jgi:hypothetical protein